MTLITKQPPQRYDPRDQSQLRQEIEQRDRENLKRTGDIDFPYVFTARQRVQIGSPDVPSDLTIGLVIDQGANDDKVIVAKSSDIDHGLTAFTDTDTFFAVVKRDPSEGGASIFAYQEDGPDNVVMGLVAVGGAPDTTKSIAGRSLIEPVALEHDGAGNLVDATADANIFGVRTRRGGTIEAVLILDEDGDLWLDGDLTTGNVIVGVETAITASTTQTQGQQPLTAAANLVETVANANDVVTLPAAVAGLGCEVYNDGASTLQIFPASGDSIQGGTVDASITLSAGNSISFRAFDATRWYY